MAIQKIIRKSMYWHRHGHPVAMRGEYARIRRDSENSKKARKRLARWFKNLPDLWDSIRR